MKKWWFSGVAVNRETMYINKPAKWACVKIITMNIVIKKNTFWLMSGELSTCLSYNEKNIFVFPIPHYNILIISIISNFQRWHWFQKDNLESIVSSLFWPKPHHFKACWLHGWDYIFCKEIY